MLHGHSILIVEPEVGPFVTALQAAIDNAGAETLVARDVATALQRCEQFRFSAALVNAEHRSVLEGLTERNVPALLYVRTETPKAIVASVERLLAE